LAEPAGFNIEQALCAARAGLREALGWALLGGDSLTLEKKQGKKGEWERENAKCKLQIAKCKM
jgi:hypothetical protein